MLRFFVLFVVLLIALAWITRVREEFLVERFADGAGTTMSVGAVDALQNILRSDGAEGMEAPHEVLGRVRKMLERLDQPEVWDRAVQMSDKDPGQLARMQLGIQNGGP
jgi:hypothetical protein